MKSVNLDILSGRTIYHPSDAEKKQNHANQYLHWRSHSCPIVISVSGN